MEKFINPCSVIQQQGLKCRIVVIAVLDQGPLATGPLDRLASVCTPPLMLALWPQRKRDATWQKQGTVWQKWGGAASRAAKTGQG